MKNILLCTDCSENAQKAVDQCLYFFKDQTVNYLLINTYYVEKNDVSQLVATNDVLKNEVNQCLQSEVERIKKLPYAHNISISAQPSYGKTENVVKRFIANHKIDLVVLGNQGSNYSSTQLFGSTTEKLLYEIERPKLIVPNQSEPNQDGRKVILMQKDQLNNIEWWSTITAISKLDNLNFKLVILPNAIENEIEVSIPPSINKHLTSLTDFSTYNTTELNEKVQKVIQVEKPSLLHLNIRDLSLAKQLLKEDQPKNSIYNNIPFFIEPFK